MNRSGPVRADQNSYVRDKTVMAEPVSHSRTAVERAWLDLLGQFEKVVRSQLSSSQEVGSSGNGSVLTPEILGSLAKAMAASAGKPAASETEENDEDESLEESEEVDDENESLHSEGSPSGLAQVRTKTNGPLAAVYRQRGEINFGH